jgi:hypothetical protein
MLNTAAYSILPNGGLKLSLMHTCKILLLFLPQMDLFSFDLNSLGLIPVYFINTRVKYA